MSKLEKADLLEMANAYILHLQSSKVPPAQGTVSSYSLGFNACASEVARYMESHNTEGHSDLHSRLLEHITSYGSSKQVVENCARDRDSALECMAKPKTPDQPDDGKNKLTKSDLVDASSRSKTKCSDTECIANTSDLQTLGDSNCNGNPSQTINFFKDNTHSDQHNSEETSVDTLWRETSDSSMKDIKFVCVRPKTNAGQVKNKTVSGIHGKRRTKRNVTPSISNETTDPASSRSVSTETSLPKSSPLVEIDNKASQQPETNKFPINQQPIRKRLSAQFGCVTKITPPKTSTSTTTATCLSQSLTNTSSNSVDVGANDKIVQMVELTTRILSNKFDQNRVINVSNHGCKTSVTPSTANPPFPPNGKNDTTVHRQTESPDENWVFGAGYNLIDGTNNLDPVWRPW